MLGKSIRKKCKHLEDKRKFDSGLAQKLCFTGNKPLSPINSASSKPERRRFESSDPNTKRKTKEREGKVKSAMESFHLSLPLRGPSLEDECSRIAKIFLNNPFFPNV